jgi:hypothetical protein
VCPAVIKWRSTHFTLQYSFALFGENAMVYVLVFISGRINDSFLFQDDSVLKTVAATLSLTKDVACNEQEWLKLRDTFFPQ